MSIIMSMLNKIKLHPSCYFFLLAAILTGNFFTVTFCSLLLLVHECGHLFTAMFLKWSTDKIEFYPFGGIAKLEAAINRPLKEELLVLCMGPIAQILCFEVLQNFNFSASHWQIISAMHHQILAFNLLPILPLDGGRILQCLLCYFVSYYHSFLIMYAISFGLLFIFCILFLKFATLSLLLVMVVLVFRLQNEYKKTNYYLEKFLLERYLYQPTFKKKKIVRSPLQFKRDYQHVLHINHHYLLEKEYLYQKYHFGEIKLKS